MHKTFKGLHKRPALWDPSKEYEQFGPALFDNNGLMLGGEEAAAAVKKSTQRLVEAIMTGEAVQDSQQQSFLLPLFQRGAGSTQSSQGATTPVNTCLVRASRARLLMVCFTKRLLLEVVQADKAYMQDYKGYHHPDALQCLLARASWHGWR